jgi:hypothetical protein
MLTKAMQGQNVVYTNLADIMEHQARAIVNAILTTGVNRMIDIATRKILVVEPMHIKHRPASVD